MRTIRRLLKLSLPYKFWMLLSALVGFFTIGSSIGLLMTSAYIISKAALHPYISELQVGIVGVRFFGIARGVFRYIERLISHDTTFKLLARFRVWFYRALEPLAPARLMHFKSADLLNRIMADIQTLEHFYVRVIAPPIVAVFISLLMWFLMGIFNPLFSIALLVFHLLAAFAVPLISYLYSKGLGRQLIQIRSRMHILLVDAVQGLSELQIFGRSGEHFQEIEGLNRRYESLQKRMAFVSAMHESLIGLLMNGAVLTMLVIAIPMVREGALEGVYLAVLSLGIMASFEAVLPLPETVQFLEMNARAAERLFELIDAEPEVTAPVHPLPPPSGFGLHIQKLSFRYPGARQDSLQEIELHVPPRSKIAVVGASGAGKSTLINLLLRFWDYRRGSITLGGKELRDLEPEAVRAQFAVVSQRTYLFNGTIKENLLLANPRAGEAELIAACRRAQIHDFIEQLDQGYDSWIGEQGLRLSGGERQRLAIARAELKNAPILILDEATANLDAITEEEVLNTILHLAGNKTVIHITHRLKGLDAVDRIYVLHQGRIVQQGVFNDLRSSEGMFRQMWQIQAQNTLIEQTLV